MTYVITDACLDVMDRSCVAQCPVECISPGQRMLYIDPDTCIDCGACEPVCPQSAIHLAEAIPPELGRFRQINADFYLAADYGPAGAGGRSEGVDHPAVRGLPAQG